MSLCDNEMSRGDCWARVCWRPRLPAAGTQAAETTAAGTTAPRVVPVTVAPLEHRAVERTVEVMGTLRGWEQVTLGSKRTGRVIKIHHDIGDRVQPGEPLVELDPVDARLAMQEAESKYLGELVKLGITEQQAEEFVKKYGFSEQLLNGPVADEAIARTPAVIEKRLAREKKQQYLMRQRALTQRNAGTPQDLDDAENDWRIAAASYDSAIQAARTTIANAFAAKVALNQAAANLERHGDPGPDAQAATSRSHPYERALLRRHPAAGLGRPDDQGRGSGRRAGDRRPDPSLEPGSRAILR